MKLRAVTLTEVRQFLSPVRVGGIGDGVNVLCAPNESGKSTLFDALHAVFFIPHRSAKIRTLRPATGGNPEISVELEDTGGLLEIRKRWGRGAYAAVSRNGREIARADEAEAMIAALTRAPEEGGPAGLLWVRQGVTEFDDGDKAAKKSREDLMSSVTGEFAALTGGKRMDRALARAREELDRLVTSRGPRAGGPLEAAVKEAEGLEARVAALTSRAQGLRDALDARRVKRRQLAELSEAGEVAARAAALAAAQAGLLAAERHEGQRQAAVSALNAAEVSRTAARRDIEARGRAAMSAEGLRGTLGEASAQAGATQARAEATAAELATATEAQTRARARHESARTLLETALAAEAQRAGAERRERLVATLAEAEALAATLPALRTAASTGPDTATLDALDKAVRDLSVAIELAQSAAPRLAFLAAPGIGPLTLNGSPLSADPRPVPEAVALELPGLGSLRIEPGAGDSAERLTKARGSLARALQNAGAETPEAGRDAARARTEATQHLKAAQDALRRLAPEGIDALKVDLARLAPSEATDAPDLPQAQQDTQAAKNAEAAAEAETARARAAQEAAREAALIARHDRDALARRLEEAEAELSRLPSAADLDQTLTKAEAARDAALRSRDALAENAPDLAACRAALARAQSVAQGADAEINALKVALAGLDATVEALSAEGVEEDLADAALRLTTASETRAALWHEVAVLRALITALEAAQAAARDRYFEPVLTELRPMLRLLWPGAELRFDGDSLLPVELLRDGRSEAIGTLSGGTREQIALLVRLAFARLLATGGRHAPVILDDALVFTDDDRMEAMFTALHAQAEDLQILVLSCRNRALRQLGGKKLVFEALAAPA